MGNGTTPDFCNDTRPCFARDGYTGRCRALSETYQHDGECKFCKPPEKKRKAISKRPIFNAVMGG